MRCFHFLRGCVDAGELQVGLLVGDMMEVIEKRVEEENRRAKTQAADTTRPGKGGDSDEAGVREGRDKKFAGFFT